MVCSEKNALVVEAGPSSGFHGRVCRWQQRRGYLCRGYFLTTNFTSFETLVAHTAIASGSDPRGAARRSDASYSGFVCSGVRGGRSALGGGDDSGAAGAFVTGLEAGSGGAEVHDVGLSNSRYSLGFGGCSLASSGSGYSWS